MDDPNIIATLIATKSLTERAFALEHNKPRYHAPTSDTRPFSKENTPFPGEDSDDEYNDKDPKDEDYTAHRLRLTFDKPPKSMNNGFVFGWGPDCDIQLVDREDLRPGDRKKVQQVSQKHFAINFDAQRRVILQDTSTNGTSISYDGKAGEEIRSHFTWIIFPDIKNIEVSIPRANLSFKIKLGSYDSCKAQFYANVDAVFPPKSILGRSGLASPIRQLKMRSGDTSIATSGAATPRHGPIYLAREQLGKGSFGEVYIVVDVSTGNQYAGKSFFRRDHTLDREVAVMKALTHEHIVRFVNFREKPTPLLVMQYLPLGNLADAHRASPIAFEETVALLSQALQGLEYLNSRGFIHRDIKPANILISYRTPLTIKLADFGLAKHDRNGRTNFKTFVGTHLYAAPEIYTGEQRPYTYAVDIWSLGIVALELAYGLPEAEPGKFSPDNWFYAIHITVQKLVGSDDLIGFLSDNMLRFLPARRLSASECLEKVHEIERTLSTIPTRRAHQTTSATPTEKASVLTTLMWVSKDGQKKRQRSSDSNSHAESNRRKIMVRYKPLHYGTTMQPQTYDISNAMSCSNRRGTMYESVLNFLRGIQIGADSSETPDLHTAGMVHTLCHQLKRLEICKIKTHTDHNAEKTILTAVTETREFTLANFTPSDLANSIADLAHQLIQIMHLWSSDPETLHRSHVGYISHQDMGETGRNSGVRNLLQQMDPARDESYEAVRTPTRASPARSPQASTSASSPMEDAYSLTTDLSRHRYGLTYPSALLDFVNVSGCAPPSNSTV